jgi:anti-sigma-K factor RskA
MFEHHLSECERCRAEVRGLVATVAEVAAAQAAGPPAGLRDGVLAQVAMTSQLPPGAARDAGAPVPGHLSGEDAAPSPGGVQAPPHGGSETSALIDPDAEADDIPASFGDDAGAGRTGPMSAQEIAKHARADSGAGSDRGERQHAIPPAMPRFERRAQATPARRSWRMSALIAGAAAVAALAFGLGSWNAQRSQHSLVVTPADEVTQVVTAADAEMSSLAMTGAPGSKVIVAPSMGQAVIMAEDLPMPAQGMVYQAWVMDRSGAKHGMETFVPDAEGAVEAMVHGDFADATRLEVTVEPLGGSDAPTSPPVGVATLT